MKIDLYEHQKQAVRQLQTGSILCGGVGTGKSRTALAYYFFKECGATDWGRMKTPKDLYIITTARKRDTGEWLDECSGFAIDPTAVDSWNNIGKYTDRKGSFFIFDEQRVIGSGAWVKAFLKIAQNNHWILLSATPGDSWMDYVPVFIANGFYKNRSEFIREHVIFSRFSKYPKVDRYVNTKRLEKERDSIMVTMEYEKPARQHWEYKKPTYDQKKWSKVSVLRWDPWEEKPIKETGKLGYLMRRVANSSKTRVYAVIDILKEHPKAICFYNFDYELEMLLELCNSLGIQHAQWNGHKHEKVPNGDKWLYLVQYTAGAEGWNCITTDTVIFYSLNYSYKIMTQAAGRIDRLNTPFKDLHYYVLCSDCPIDKAIDKAIKTKKDFNEQTFLKKIIGSDQNHNTYKKEE